MSHIKKHFWNLIAMLIAFSIGEMAARIGIHILGNPIDRVRNILWVDSSLGWKQKENLNTTFLGEPLHTDSFGFREAHLHDTNFYPVWVLGPSSAFGWGVGDSDTYPAQLEAKLGVHVLNGGEIGFSTFQGVKLLEKMKARYPTPKIILFSYGINDLDRHRFYFQSAKPDREELAAEEPAGVTKLLNAIASSSFTSLAFKVAAYLPTSKPISGKPYLGIRVPEKDVETNVRALTAAARSMGAIPIFLTTAYFSPKSERLPKTEQKFKQALQMFDSGEFEKAKALFVEIENSDHGNEADAYLASIAQSQGFSKDAKRYADSALAKETDRIFRDVNRLNTTIQSAAKEAGAESIDILKILGGIQAEKFVDPVHFSRLGNERIAAGLYHLIQPALQAK